MEIRICKNSEALGESAAKYTAQIIKDAIAEKGMNGQHFLVGKIITLKERRI